MNFGVVLIGLILICAASIGIIAMASTNAEAPVDTMGNTLSEQSNATHGIITNVSAPLAEVGGGLGLAVAVVLVCGSLFGILGLILYYKKSNGGYGGR